MDDSFLWLEELNSAQAMAWVENQNQQTVSQIAQGTRFQSLQAQAFEILCEPDKVCAGQVFQDQVYFLWQDSEHPLGLWRRAPLSSFPENPKWEILLDLDAYSQKKGKATFLKSVEFLQGSQRVLMCLSPQGGDACEMFEWDLNTKDFVQDGFYLPLSKDYSVRVSENHILWASTEKPSHCGYATRIYSWKRGQKAEMIFEVPETHMSLWPMVIRNSSGHAQVFFGDTESWDHTFCFHWKDQKSIEPLALPPDVWMAGAFQDRLVIFLKRAWGPFLSGSILIAKHSGQWSHFSQEDFETVFVPNDHSSCKEIARAKDELFLVVSDNLKHKVLRWTPTSIEETPLPEGVNVSAIYSSEEEDRVFSLFQSFTQPPGWYEWKENSWQMLQKGKEHFSSETVTAKQEWASSADGTQVPYWIVYDQKFSGPRPTLQYGYGGFRSPMFPSYSGIQGALWIERGGAYVLAQIRGGSEFGTRWHEAAILENKQRSYDDFIAVSEDLIRKGYTTAQQLSIQGRSNGGLLVGATVTQRPDLYGAALIEVPLLDMIRYVELPPGSSWIGEYGDPRDAKMREIILRYSPYQNIEKNSKYPPILIRTARSDDRVHPAHARKMAAKMQILGHSVFFFEEELGGHGSTPLKDRAFQYALVFEFLWRNLAPGSSF